MPNAESPVGPFLTDLVMLGGPFVYRIALRGTAKRY